MNILGINSVYHESAAALVVDGALVAASEEERFNRIKHGKQSDVDNPHQFPEHAIRFCLDYAGLRGCDIDLWHILSTPSCAECNLRRLVAGSACQRPSPASSRPPRRCRQW